MARDRGLKVVISGDAKGLDRAFAQVTQGADHVERRMDGFGRKVGGAFKVAGAAAAGALVVGLKKSVDAAIEAEKSQAKLEAQLKASGISYRAHAKQIDEVIQRTSRLAGLDDEDLSDAFTNVVRATGSVNTGLKDMAVVADLARAKHMDVARAGELVAKVHAGNVGALKRMGIAITPVTAAQDKLKESTKHATVEQQRAAKEADKTATAQKALGELQRRVGGQAAAYGKTTAGAQDRFRVAVENLQEKIGSALLPTITKVTSRAAKFVDEMSRGVGAGGRFADKLKEIADRIRPIVKFFADHPRLIAVAVGAWVTYRVAASAALVASRLKLIGMFAGLGPRAAAGGAVAGRSFGGAAATSADTTFNRTAPGRFGKATAGFSAAGSVIGVALGAAAALELVDQLRHTMAGFYDSLKSKGGIQGVLGAIGKLGTQLAGKVPVIGGRSLEQTLGSRPKSKPTPLPAASRRPSRPSHPASGPGQNAPGGHASAHAASVGVTAHAASAGPTAHAAASEPHPDDIVAAITGRADLIDSAHVPYLWGGGHGGRFTGKVIPMDCSGAVSAALGIDPRVSGDFVTWGSPGDGGNSGVTVYANRTHVLMKINGRFWGTSRSNPGGGPGWIQGGIPAGYLSGFTARHMGGTTATTGGTAAPSRPGRPTRLSAGLVGRGGSKVAPKGMGGVALGRRGTQGAAFYDPADRPIGGAAEFEYGTALNANEAATAEQSGNTGAQIVAANKRRFQLGMRIAAIDAALKNPRHSAAYRTKLLTERASLVGELNQLGAVGTISGGSSTSGDAGPAGPTEDPNQPLIDAQNAAADAARQQTEALKALKDAIDEQNHFAASVAATSLAAAQRALADIIGGQIVGTGYDPRAMTAGAGALARY